MELIRHHEEPVHELGCSQRDEQSFDKRKVDHVRRREVSLQSEANLGLNVGIGDGGQGHMWHVVLALERELRRYRYLA